MGYLKIARVADFHIIYLPAGLFQVCRRLLFQCGIVSVAVFHSAGNGLQFAVELRGLFALGFAQVLVAAGERQAVGGAADVHRYDFHPEIQIGSHALQDNQLLVVFFAEAGVIGLNNVEQLGHHGGHAAEMPRAECTAQLVLQIGRLDVVLLGHIRIQLLLARREEYGHAFAGQFGGILFQRARIAVEILALAELQAVDKNAHHHLVCPFGRFAHQGQVPFVQVAHGGHECHAAGFAAPVAQFLNGMDNFHGGFALSIKCGAVYSAMLGEAT